MLSQTEERARIIRDIVALDVGLNAPGIVLIADYILRRNPPADAEYVSPFEWVDATQMGDEVTL